MSADESLLYRALARLLTVGVIVSIVLMALGYALLVAHHATARNTWLPMRQVLPRAVAGDAAGILDLGVLILLVTPTVRVVAALALFAVERQGRYVAISTGVLSLLTLSIMIAVKSP